MYTICTCMYIYIYIVIAKVSHVGVWTSDFPWTFCCSKTPRAGGSGGWASGGAFGNRGLLSSRAWKENRSFELGSSLVVLGQGPVACFEIEGYLCRQLQYIYLYLYLYLHVYVYVYVFSANNCMCRTRTHTAMQFGTARHPEHSRSLTLWVHPVHWPRGLRASMDRRCPLGCLKIPISHHKPNTKECNKYNGT